MKNPIVVEMAQTKNHIYELASAVLEAPIRMKNIRPIILGTENRVEIMESFYPELTYISTLYNPHGPEYLDEMRKTPIPCDDFDYDENNNVYPYIMICGKKVPCLLEISPEEYTAMYSKALEELKKQDNFDEIFSEVTMDNIRNEQLLLTQKYSEKGHTI